ncbi:Gfo/Idh/MocA family oxidoreductase [Chelativorans sp. AA-79]|uniref:Gfo/Idh/MocA family protein n=1 Tax=Chelativorans sp. AA-79 TaxID=3028735 RepID=UPI0023F9BBF6|nr:Gfo/Idh/MocA family oxidoreductase [Chelativorans sp. AA-79]WEX08845.1 Gfo/Idh/MocA family oxidoreductase [Chelativorans sp. AA-79]
MRLLILGTGKMANQHATRFAAIPGVHLVGGVDTDSERLSAFCAAHKIEHGFSTTDEALAWGEFDAVTNVTPDAAHYATSLACIAAGKHVLCEKPLATNYAEATEMADAAERAGVVAMVNLSYRNVAEIHAAREMVLSGRIGEVKHIEASYLQSWLVSKAWGDWRTGQQWLWRLSKGHGSNGTLGDIGIHILDFASYGAGTDIETVTSRLKTFHKADGDRIGDYTLDANDSFIMTAGFANGAVGVIHATRWATGHLNDLRVRIYGDKGGIEVQHDLKSSKLRVCLDEDAETATWRDMEATPVASNYERFVNAVRFNLPTEPSFRHAAGLQRILDLAAASDETAPAFSRV